MKITMEDTVQFKTPYYLVDESKLLDNLKKIQLLRDKSGAKSVLALKCFSTWAVFDLMSKYMDGTTSSSLYEAKLGKEKFEKVLNFIEGGADPLRTLEENKDEVKEGKEESLAAFLITYCLSQYQTQPFIV